MGKRNIALKIFIFQVLVLIISIIITVVSLSNLNNIKQEYIDSEANRLKVKTVSYINMHKQVLLSGALGLSKNTQLKELLMQGNANELKKILQTSEIDIFTQVFNDFSEAKESSKISFQIVSAEGKILASTNQQDIQTNMENISNYKAFKNMQRLSKIVSTLDYDKEGIVLRVLVPVIDDGKIIGSLHLVENIESVIGSYLYNNKINYLLTLAPEYNDYAVNVESSLYFNKGLVLNYKTVDEKYLDILKEKGLNNKSSGIFAGNNFITPLNLYSLISTDKTDMEETYIGTLYLAVPDVIILNNFYDMSDFMTGTIYIFVIVFILCSAITTYIFFYRSSKSE